MLTQKEAWLWITHSPLYFLCFFFPCNCLQQSHISTQRSEWWELTGWREVGKKVRESGRERTRVGETWKKGEKERLVEWVGAGVRGHWVFWVCAVWTGLKKRHTHTPIVSLPTHPPVCLPPSPFYLPELSLTRLSCRLCFICSVYWISI